MGAYKYSGWNFPTLQSFNQILCQALSKNAIDLYLQVGSFPTIRKKGSIEILSEDFGLVNDEKIRVWITEVLDESQMGVLERNQSVDLSYELPKQGRFRINISKSNGSFVFSIRIIGRAQLGFENLHLPKILEKICGIERGLVLVTGKAGSGKSTTLASMVREICRNQPRHVVTIEDPIEYRHKNGKGLVTQKEIGKDVKTFSEGLKVALRQNPDVITIGEMRDKETMCAALVAAETGHLVLSTMHSSDAPSAIHRILSSYTSEQQRRIRTQLASTLRAVVSLRLMPSLDGERMVPAVEVMIVNDRIRQMIRDGHRIHEIHESIEEGYSTFGMQTFDQSLLKLYTKGIISMDMAIKKASRPADLALRCSGVKAEDGAKWVEFDKDPNSAADRFEIEVEEPQPETWDRSKPTHPVRKKRRVRKVRTNSGLFEWFK